MIRRLLSMVAVIVGLVLFVTACSSAPQEEPAPTESAAESAPDGAESAADETASSPASEPAAAPAGPPILVVTTERGTFEIETFPNEAPKTVEHVVALVKRNFYNGQRVHRVVPGFVIQFGDPNTRDARLRDRWGTGGSGKIVGVSEWNPKRRHRRGAVAMAHPGDATLADSQMYVILEDSASARNLDGDYTVFGQVITGMDVVLKTQLNDAIKRVTIRDQDAPPKP